MFSTLISVADLSANLQTPDWLIVDCRFDLARPDAGEEAYRGGHIPGAVYAHLDRDLASAVTAATGRHPLPTAQQFADTLGRWGATPESQVIAYDADNSAFAARLWWLLRRWIGHRAVAVLDGGFKAWMAADLPVTQDIPVRPATEYPVKPDRTAWLDANEVAERVKRNDWLLLDARGPDRYAGKVEPIDPVAGHVPGAHNHPFALNLAATGHFLPPGELRARFEKSQAGVSDAHTIVMCGSGVTACHSLLALEVAGKQGAKLYAGSWSEWIRDPARPVSRPR
jgi:thiosulfate/3-mercaptopyruvate sulfurtransferase